MGSPALASLRALSGLEPGEGKMDQNHREEEEGWVILLKLYTDTYTHMSQKTDLKRIWTETCPKRRS